MIYHFSLSPKAEADLLEAALWYESQQTGLGEKFIKKVESYFLRIQNYPFHFPLKKETCVRLTFRSFLMLSFIKLSGIILLFLLFSTPIKIQQKSPNLFETYS